MSLSKPFPLLHLPRLPLFKVFDGIGVQEQFYLSICSSKTKYAIKYYTRRQKFGVTFHFTNNFEFSLKIADSTFLIDVQPIFGSVWPFLSSVATISGTPFEKKMKRLLLFLLDVFNTPSISLNIVERRYEFVSGFINFIHSLKLKIQSLKIKSKRGEDKIIEFVLDNCRNASEVHLESQTTTRFDYLKKSLIPKFNLDKLTINNAEWVTTWHLTTLFINCKHLDFDNCSTDLIKVDQFIKKWVNGSSQLSWASLTFDCDDFSLDAIMRGIPSTVVPTEEMERGQYIDRAYRIEQQKTGREAYVFSDYRTIVITDSLQ